MGLDPNNDASPVRAIMAIEHGNVITSTRRDVATNLPPRLATLPTLAKCFQIVKVDYPGILNGIR